MKTEPDAASGILSSRQMLEAREEQWLAPYAMKSKETRGRYYPEDKDPRRTAYSRDRDRIIHTSAFRRLEYKTQVFVNHEGDHYRTRLTHTLEVTQIAVSIARMLRLNEDLVEAVALAHDLGHPPFGHAGEDALMRLMKDHGGFDHNLQGLRIVEFLEARYPNFPGLNLTWEVRDSLNKHRIDLASTNEPAAAQGSLLESQVPDVADEIAYDNHDLDDGLSSGILNEEILAETAIWRQARKEVDVRNHDLTAEVHKYQIIRALINRQITDLVNESTSRLERLHISSVEDVRSCGQRLITFSAEMQELRAPLKALLWRSLYSHPRVMRMAERARRLITALFELYVRQPDQLPGTTRSRIASGEKPERVVCDYIAGMTDRYCLKEYQRHLGPSESFEGG